jgi:hypothetical protein
MLCGLRLFRCCPSAIITLPKKSSGAGETVTAIRLFFWQSLSRELRDGPTTGSFNFKGAEMKNRSLALFMTILALGVISGQCPKAINPNDSTKPIVTIKVRDKDGLYKAIDETSLRLDGSESLNFMCIAEDPEGVKSVGYSYRGDIGHCTVGSTFFNGVFVVMPLPAGKGQDLGSNPQSGVVTILPLTSQPDLKGPFKCTVPGEKTGLPLGGTITLVCEGGNWSSNKQNSRAVKSLTINLTQ